MREKIVNQKSNRKLSILKGFGILIAFVVVFTLVLALGVFDGSTTTDITNQIAYAGIGSATVQSENTPVDISNAIASSSVATTKGNLSNSSFPGSNSDTTFTTSSLSFSEVNFSGCSFKCAGYQADSGDNPPDVKVNADAGTFYLGVKEKDNENRFNFGIAVVSIELNSGNDQFMKKLVNNSTLAISCTLRATISFGNVEGNDSSHVGYVFGSDTSGRAAGNLYDFTAKYSAWNPVGYVCTYNGNGNYSGSGTTFSKTINLGSGQKSLYLGIYVCGKENYKDNYSYVQLSEISVTYNITRNNTYLDSSSTLIDDGAAPQITSFDKTTSNIQTIPYRPDNTQNNTRWDVWYDNSTTTGAKVASLLSKAKDVVSVGSKVKLYSYSSGLQFSFIWKNITAYKRLSFKATDFFDYDGTGDALEAGSSFPLQAAGIKSIQVGHVSSASSDSAVFDLAINQTAFKNTSIMETGGTDSNIKKIYWQKEDESVDECGFAYVKRDSAFPSSGPYSARNTVTVVVYFTKNCDITVTVSDYGDKSVKQKVEVRGIDTTPAVAPTLSQDDNMISTSNNYSSIDWIYSNTYNFDGEDHSDALDDSLWYAPHIYYYEMQKLGNANTESDPTKEFPQHTNLTKALLLNRYPYAVGEFTGFSYDFTRGCTSNGIYPSGGITSNGTTDNYCKGNGYYRVYIYALDLAGNLSNIVRVYYFKVDYEEAAYDLSMSYTFNNTNFTITSENNGQWATSAMVATITQNKVSLSGNVIVFEDAVGESHTISIGSYATQLKSPGTPDGPCIAQIDGSLLANIPTLTIGGVTYYEIVENQIYFAAIQIAYGQSTFIYKIYFLPDIEGLISYATLDYMTIIEIANGVNYDSASVIYYNDDWHDSNGNDGVIIRVDRTLPAAPSISDENGNIVGIDISSVLPTNLDDLGINANTERHWYTNGYTIDLNVNFPEALANTYTDDIRVYIGIVNIEQEGDVYSGFKTLSQFTNINQQTRNNISSYATVLNGIFGNNYWRAIKAGEFTDNILDIANYNLITQFGIGLRVIYTWAIDQSGNMGDVQVYYILVDPTTYFVTAQINSGNISRFGSDDASISVTDIAENPVSSFKRGDALVVKTGIASDYTIYNLKKIVGNSSRVLGLNTASIDMLEVLDTSYIKYDAGIFIITTDIESVFDYYNTESNENSGNPRVYFELTYRKVIYPTITASYARYAGLESGIPLLKVPFSISDMSEDAQSALTFTFYVDEDYSILTNSTNAGLINGADGSTPVNVGVYYVAINSDSEFYIVNQTVESQFTIVAANLHIDVKDDIQIQYLLTSAIIWEDCVEVNGLLGDAKEEYRNNGFNIFNSGRLGLKDVNGVAQDLLESIPVGTYSIYQEENFVLNNYNITFSSNKLDVIPHKIVATAFSYTKSFGNPDAIRYFDILMTEFSDVEVDWHSVFSTERVSCETIGNYYRFTPVLRQWIKRETGEDVGVYEIYLTTNEFVIESNNFTIVLTTPTNETPTLTITQRQITAIPVSGQKYEDDQTSWNPEHISGIRYSYHSDEARFFTSEYITGELALASTPTGDPLIETGKKTYYYEIVQWTLASKTPNIELLFQEGVLFAITEITEGEVIHVSQKTKFTVPYGVGLGDEDLAWNTTDYITVAPSSLTQQYKISWIISSIPANRNVGTYQVNIIGNPVVRNKETGEEIPGYFVAVDTIYVTITPLPITITPVISTTTKIYGELDKTSWNITYTAIRNNVDMNDKIQPGEFIRAVFRKSDNTMMALESRFDGISDAIGELTYEGVPAYYGLAVRRDFETNDPNYSIVYADFSAVRFTITVRKIVVNPETSFFGVNKNYDGSVVATYAPGDTSIVFSDYLARQDEDIKISFNAAYDSANAGINKKITFSNLALTGSAAYNYVLYFGTDLENVPYVAQTVEISKLIPTASGEGNIIQIYSITVAIGKSDFTISKQYDGTTAMSAADVTIDETSVLKSFNYSVNGSSYPSIEVSNAYSTNVTLIFTYEAGASMDNMNIVDNQDEDITIVQDDTAGKITIVLRNMPVSITKKVLTIDDIEGIAGVDKYYDSSTFVQVTPTISASALAYGDSSADTFIKFVAHAATITSLDVVSPDQAIVYNGTTYNVIYEKNASTTPYSIFLEDVAITSTSSNYLVDISVEDLAQFSIENKDVSSVVINKAQLNLSAIISAAEYTGEAAVDSGLIGTATQVTSAISSDLIVTSPYDPTYIVDIYNELANITYNIDGIKAYYTKNGVLYPYVNINGNGNIVRHEISIANLILSKSAISILSNDQLNAILANYTLAGTAYTIAADGSAEVTDPFNLRIGKIIESNVYTNGGKGLASVITAILNKKAIQINAANISLPNKVYDGTTNGSATVDDLSAIGIVAVDVDKINVSLTATYATKDVGTRIRVDIYNVTFTDKEQYDVDHSSNYAIGTSSAYAYRAITKSYAVVDFDLASKVYDGTNSVAQSAIKPTIYVPYSRDNGLYSVNTSFAFLGGKDVIYEDSSNVIHNEESDTATIYGIKLVSSRTTVNYDLYVRTVVPFILYDGNGVATEEFEDYITANPLVSREATAFYFALNGTNEVYTALATESVKTVRVKDYAGDAPEIGEVVAGYGTYLGYYVANTIRYYAFSSSESDAKDYTVMPIEARYDHFINAATLAFSIKPKSGSSSFNKTFDGTTDLTQEYNVTFDISLTEEEETAIRNALVGKYASSNVGSTSVVFTINDSVVLNNPNYSVADIRVSVAGYITKAVINSYLEDTEVPYGTLITNRKYNIIYGTNAYEIDSDAPLVNRNAGDTVDIFVKDGVFGYYQKSLDTNGVEGKTYYTFTPSFKQVSITRFSQDRHYYYIVGDVYTEATIYESEETYYICESIEYTPVEFSVLEEMYEFVPIAGTIIAPSIKSSVTNSTNAKAEGYSMYLNGGSATNFNFKYSYTNGTNSKLIVTKVTLYTYVIDDYVDPEGSSENYASSVVYDAEGTMPQFALGYAASPTTMLSGFVNGQTSAIFNQAANTAPITKVYLFDGTNYTECTAMASLTVSEELPAGSYYIIYIDIADAVAINYTFALKAGSEMSDSVKLLLQYPDITDYVVSDTTVTYDGTQQNVKVTGNSGATVSYQYFTNSEMTTPVGTSVVNAGEYYAKVTISKPKYRALVQYASLIIKKANFKISIPSKDVDYDGLDHEVDIRTSAVAPSVLSLNVTYQLNGEIYSSATNVGSYFVTATYTTRENYAGYNGGQYNDNFNSATGTGSIVVQGAVVQIIVKEEDKMARLVGDEVQMNYSISIDEKYKDMLESAGYDYDNYVEELIDYQVIYVQYYNAEAETTTDYMTEVTETGVYNYIIISEDSNLILRGSVSGTFTVGVESIEYLNAAEKLRASITAEGNTILNANASIVYEKVTYTSKINSQATTEAYKTAVANNKLYTQIESNIPSLATNFHNVNLAGVLKVQMKVVGADGSSYVIQPNGKVKVKVYSTVAIDDTIEVYQVTADGKLAKVDYTYSNGFITYETDYVNTLVFVKVGTFLEFVTTNWWLIAVAAGILVAILVVVIVPSVVVTKKKKKAKAAALATAGVGSANAPVAETTTPVETPVSEPAPVEELPIETPPVEEAPPMEDIPPVEEPPMDMPPEDIPPIEEPPMVEPEPTPVEEPVAPQPEEPKKAAPPPGAVGTKAPPPGAVGQKPAAAPKKAPPPGAVGTKPAAAPKKAPPPGAIGKKD